MSIILRLGIRNRINNIISKPNREALFVFGHQKSGTTAIAELLARYVGKSLTIDPPCTWEPYFSKLLNGEINLEKHIIANSYDFSKDIIKDPNLSYFFNQLEKTFNIDQYIVIVRNPFDNIRSILNRLGVPGDKDEINIENLPYYWHSTFGIEKGENYVRVLAKNWIKAYENINMLESDKCILVKYEDFLMDKEKFIGTIASNLKLVEVNDISKLVDHQFQPKGVNQSKEVFFNDKNINIIYDTCFTKMKYFGYDV